MDDCRGHRPRRFRFYSLSCETHSGTRTFCPPVEKHSRRFYSLSCETYSGTCRGRRSARRALVSIRCRARRTAEPGPSRVKRTSPASGFYSLSCETYSGTARPTTSSSTPPPVSIRCRARRTAERVWIPSSTRQPSRFYSLSCETYGGTSLKVVDTEGAFMFLFAVVRDVQRNGHMACHEHRRDLRFLFAVVRDVQRNHAGYPGREPGLDDVSIRCRARRTAEPPGQAGRAGSHSSRFYSLSCETYSGTSSMSRSLTSVDEVSIRCRARRTAEPRSPLPAKPD